ncbi:MAG: outer membrane protein assembly factor BamD [Myxococcota bacterium]|nr:outer membrane protein assembly factor BamD [Myxococcota bacterium]
MKCKEITKNALAHLRGETSQVAKQRFEAHVAQCEKCGPLVHQMSELTEVTRAQRFLPASDVRDRMLHSLMGRIKAVDKGEQAAIVSSKRRFRLALTLMPASAAMIAFGLLVWIFNEQPNATSTEPTVGQPAAPLALSSTAMETKLLASDLIVGVAPGSRWVFKEDVASYDLTVEKGRLWIRFSGHSQEHTLHVHGPGVTVQVTGTVFLIEARPGQIMEVGVYEGQVAAVSDAGEETIIEPGEIRRADGRVHALDRDAEAAAATWLSRLDDLFDKDSAPARDKETDKPFALSAKKLHVNPRTVDLYARAESEMAKGHFKRAARYLERLISAGPDSPESGTARLDLARLYANQLNAPQKAVRHLNAFLRHHPRGAKARLARQMLSELQLDDEVAPGATHDTSHL